MAKQKLEQSLPKQFERNESTREEGSASPVAEEGAPPLKTVSSGQVDDLWRRIEAERREVLPDRVVTIPIWGWTGDGKTTALLTAQHYCSAFEHRVSFAFANDIDELNDLEERVPAYRGRGLGELASQTKSSLDPLLRRFIEGAEWPAGTNRPSAYLFTIRGLSRRLGYVVFPDLMGGSYESNDETARSILRQGHACVILIRSSVFANRVSTRCKQYRDEIHKQILRCAELRVPTAILLTRSDLKSEPVSDVENFINMIISEAATDEGLFAVFQVSVIDAERKPDEPPRSEIDRDDAADGGTREPPPPPPPQDRHPDRLVDAFRWVVARALGRPAEEIHKSPPPVDFRPAGVAVTPAGTSRAELRRVFEFSDSVGDALGSSVRLGQGIGLCFLTSSGELFEASFAKGIESQHTWNRIGVLDGHVSNVRRMQFAVRSGVIIVGRYHDATALWHGSRGSTLTKVELGVTAAKWVALGSDTVAAVDTDGRAHIIRLEERAGKQVEWQSMVSPSENLACGFVERTRQLYVSNGQQVEAIEVTREARFGARYKPPTALSFDTPDCEISSSGLMAALLSSEELVVALSKTVSLGTVMDEGYNSFALSPDLPLVAYCDQEKRLRVASIVGDAVKVTEPDLSPALSAVPETMVWFSDGVGPLLAVTFEDKTWAVFRPLALMGN